MATYLPVVIKNGEFQQIQSGDDFLVNGLKAFASGGVFIGAAPADPGAGSLRLQTPTGGNNLPLTISKAQVTDDAGFGIRFQGGAAGTTDRGYIGITHTGANTGTTDTLFIGELADMMGFRYTTGLQFGKGSAASVFFGSGVNIGGTADPGAGSLQVIRNIVGRVTPTYSASITIDASTANLFVITVTNGTAFTMNAPTNPKDGQHIIVTFRNTSGGAAGTITWNAVWKIISPFPALANGTSNSLFFYYDGTNWIMSNYMTGVPN